MTRTERTTAAHVALRPYLIDGEELRWSGRPSEKKRYMPNLMQIAMGLFTLAFSLSWEFMAFLAVISSFEEGFIFIVWLFPIAGSFFVWMTSYNLWNLFVGIPRTMERTVYGVTDSRVMILYPSRKTMVLQEYRYVNMPEIRLEEEKGGMGSIYFAADPTEKSRDIVEKLPYHIAFWRIADARRVYDLIKEQQSYNP